MEPLMTKQDVCEYLNVTESWLTAEVQANRIPHIRISYKTIRFRPEQIRAFIESKEESPATTTDEKTTTNHDAQQV